MAASAIQDSRESTANKVDLLNEDISCAICFEQVNQTTELPCACNAAYCAQCWDRALAQSFNSCGEARCPTCRSPVCVDFDPERSCLVFSRAMAAKGLDVNDVRTEAVAKLRQQALPAQVRLLQLHGKRHPALSEMARAPEQQVRRMSVAELKRHIITLGAGTGDCLEKDDLVNRLVQEANKKQMIGHVLGERFATLTDELPACVCGSFLVRVSGAERLMRCCDKIPVLQGLPRDSDRYQMFFARLTSAQGAICFCDLCGANLPCSSAVWTCENGDTTILHATSYDICDACFAQYAVFGESVSCPDDAGTQTSSLVVGTTERSPL